MNVIRDKRQYADEARRILDAPRYELRRPLYPGERQRVEALIARVEFEVRNGSMTGGFISGRTPELKRNRRTHFRALCKALHDLRTRPRRRWR